MPTYQMDPEVRRYFYSDLKDNPMTEPFPHFSPSDHDRLDSLEQRVNQILKYTAQVEKEQANTLKALDELAQLCNRIVNVVTAFVPDARLK